MQLQTTNLTGGNHVYQAIAEVMTRLTKEGIGKNRRNEQQGYSFRGIDDVYNALAPILADVGLCILPAIKSREVVERTSGNGRSLFYVTVNVDFTFVSTKDGSCHVVSMPGEAMDSGDKATNKAMSAAYKYACLQTFCIPTEGDNDADSTTHVVATPEAKPANPLDLVAKPTAKVAVAKALLPPLEEALLPPLVKTDVPIGYPLWIPGKSAPHKVFNTLDEWANAYEDMAEWTATETGHIAKDRKSRLKDLKECNAETLGRIDTMKRVRHTSGYQRRTNELEAAQ